MEGYLRGLESREQNRSHGVTGYGSCRGRAAFDGSGGHGLEDTEYIYTLKYTLTHTHTHTDNLA